MDSIEEPCKRCSGSGKIKNPLYPSPYTQKTLRTAIFLPCPVCLGNKKLTWLEQVFGINVLRMDAERKKE